METDRLYLREETREVLKEVLNQKTEEQLTFFGLQNQDQLEKELIRIKKKRSKSTEEGRKWNLIEKTTGKVIGSCGFHYWLKDHEKAELGYVLHENFRGKGFMTEALHRVLKYGFNEMNLNRIEAFISPNNLPSQKLITKLGFTQEGLLREHYKHEGQIHDSIVYSLLKSEYNNAIA